VALALEAMERFERERTEAAKKTAWYLGGCKSWYLGAGGVPANWPWNYVRFRAEMAVPRWEAFGFARGFAGVEARADARPRIGNA
jgi:hypothetical protein